MASIHLASIAVSAAIYAIDRPYDYQIPVSLQETVLPGTRVLVPFGGGDLATEGIVLALSEKPAQDAPKKGYKTIAACLDMQPVLSPEGIKLALWMRDRFFCTVYDAVRAMLPGGLWYDLEERYQVQLPPDTAYEAADRSQMEQRLLTLLFRHPSGLTRRAIYEAFGTQDPRPALAHLIKEGVVAPRVSANRRVGDKMAEVLSLAVEPEKALELAQAKRTSPARRSVLKLMAAVGRAPFGEVSYMTGASRAVLKAMVQAGLLCLHREETFRRPVYQTADGAPGEIQLTDKQEAVFQGLCGLLEGNAPACALLYGVTGSGKTQVYLQLIKQVLNKGKGAILLVPEIALTPQLLFTVSAFFGDGVAVLHSALRPGERYDEWKRIRNGTARVVVGTRSGVFAPVSNLGLIILDEEQEGSYQSDQSPRYHARDVAKYRCAREGALLLLGSATPAVESFYHARKGEYHLFSLGERFNSGPMPNVILADMREALRGGDGGAIGPVLRQELEGNLRQGQQSILLINRRGDSPLVVCGECGASPTCPNCSVHLTFHSKNGRLMCHHCGHSQVGATACPACGGLLNYVGLGTQKVQRELEALFPDTEILRLDTDTVTATMSHEAVLRRFQEKNVPILVGTQMVAKGLHFENVTLVGVVSADASLYMEDFRAGERTFSLLTQVVGRAGRGEFPGRAVIQTFAPENEIILFAARQDYEAFYETEIGLRRMRGAPPFRDLFTLTFQSEAEEKAQKAAAETAEKLRATISGKEWAALSPQVMGPTPAAIVKRRGRYRYRLIVACENRGAIRRLLAHVLGSFSKQKENKGVTLTIDLSGAEI